MSQNSTMQYLAVSLSVCRSADAVRHHKSPGDSFEDLGAREGGEEAQKDDQNAFTARTSHVAERLKVCTGHACCKIPLFLQSFFSS